jgi:hypothetical protein
MKYNDDQDFKEFISQVHTKWSNANALRANVDDQSFRTIVLAAFPCSWDPIVATLYNTSTSREAINQLMTHWSCVSRDCITNPQTSTLALQAFTSNWRDRRNLLCVNPNCRCQGYTIEDCYWEGGGKAGVFPPNFRKKKGSVFINTGEGKLPQTSANLTTSTPSSDTTSNHEVIALAALTEVSPTHDTEFPNPDPIVNTRTILPNLSNNTTQGEEGSALFCLSSNTPQSYLVHQSDPIMTLLDSGASNYCFVERDTFEQYDCLDPPRMGHSAGKGSTFNIIGVGRATFLTNVEGATLKVNMDGALHTPHLRSNLISISKLVTKEKQRSYTT